MSARNRRPITLAMTAMASVLLVGSAAQADDTLYRDLGGSDGIVRLVDKAYDHILNDDRIKATFDDVAIPRVKHMISDQICALVGGPCVYKGSDMKTVHRGIHINVSQFNALVEDLEQGMDDAGVPFRTQNRLLALLAPMERDIVTR